MKLPSIHQLYDWGLGVSVACSFVANLLPNASFLDAFPKAQKVYNAFIAFIATLAINIRHCLPSLDVSAPILGITKPLASVPPNPTQPQEK